MESKKCKHPPNRLYSWFASDITKPDGSSLVVVCCACGKILKGGAEEYEARIMARKLAGAKFYIAGRPIKGAATAP